MDIMANLMEGNASNLLDAIQIVINFKMQDGSINLMETDEDSTLVKGKK